MPFNYLQHIQPATYNLTSRARYEPFEAFPAEIIQQVYNFAYNMSFGQVGGHRDHRAGGRHRRRLGEIFINTYQGKLAEYAFYRMCQNNGLQIQEPDLEEWELGIWDNYDFEINGLHISIKSTKSYGNLLLLESADWNAEGNYTPNLANGNAVYNYIVLVRLSPDGESIMRNGRLLYTDRTDEEALRNLIYEQRWEFDIPGFITHDQLVKEVINAQPPLILPQGAMLNGRTRMDAENYYVQAGDMNNIQELLRYINENQN